MKSSTIAFLAAGAIALAACSSPPEPSAVPTTTEAQALSPVDQLVDAIATGSTAAAQAAIAAGADPSADLGLGVTPLHRAALLSRAEIVEVLAAAGADINAREDSGERPIDLAAASADAATVTALVSAGADVGENPRLSNSRHSLHTAAKAGNLDAVRAILDAGEDVDVLEGTHSTALMYAAYWGYGDVVAELLARGCDVNVRDDGNQTALYWARTQGFDDVAALIEAAGGTE